MLEQTINDLIDLYHLVTDREEISVKIGVEITAIKTATYFCEVTYGDDELNKHSFPTLEAAQQYFIDNIKEIIKKGNDESNQDDRIKSLYKRFI